MTMDYKLILSPKPKKSRPPKLVCMHATSIPTCIKFLGQFRLIEFFDNHGIIVHGLKGKFGCFESDHKGAKSTETSQYHQNLKIIGIVYQL